MVLIRGSPIVSYEKTKYIIQQMENSLCNVKVKDCSCTGFFCRIPFPDINNMLPVLITANQVIREELLNQNDAKIYITFKNDQNFIELNLNNRMKYTNREYDIAIIEIKDSDKINNYLDLDDYIIDDILKEDNNINNIYKDQEQELYIVQYTCNKLSVSYGALSRIDEDINYEFYHKCSTDIGSSGAPVFNIYNNKVIGLHKQGNIEFNENIGTFLSYPIKEFIIFNYKLDYEKLLKEFNTKYNLNIKDTKIEKLDLRWKGLGNIGFEDLCKIEFKELKELILNNNNISEIKILSKAKFKKLEILDLSQNKISNINIFENINFKGLKQLYLCYNNISDIKVFERANLKNLEILYLNDNKIDKKKNALIIQNLKSKIGNFQV